MKILLIGSTGMLGQALYKKIVRQGIEVITIARSSSTYQFDLLTECEKLIEVIKTEKPAVVINSAALINLKECENYPDKAYIINARLPGLIGMACQEINSYFVQISTDHYYANDEKVLHNEKNEIMLLNEYARTKYAGECFALTYNKSLVIRTNIVGFRNKKNEPTFIEWIISSLQAGEIITGYDDFYTSSIDVETFSDILMRLIRRKSTGILNVSSKDVASKYEFIYGIAQKLGKEQQVLKGTIKQIQGVKRANSLGLDTTRLQRIIKDCEIPTTEQVLGRLIRQFEEGAFYEFSQ